MWRRQLSVLNSAGITATINVSSLPPGPPNGPVTVTVDYEFPGFGSLFPRTGTIPLASTATMRQEF